jgi:hypothetical protein
MSIYVVFGFYSIRLVLTPPLFNEVSVPSQASGDVYMCACLCFYYFLIRCWNYSDIEVCLAFHFICSCNLMVISSILLVK